MRVCILTLGSRGDVQPYVALGKELTARGCEVIICTGESFRSLIEGNGIAFHRATLDLMALIHTKEGEMLLESPMQHMALAMKLTKELLNPAFRTTMDDFFDAAKGADLLIYHPKAIGAVDIAVKLGIPCVSMPPVPATYPITEFPNLALFPSSSFGQTINRLTYRVNSYSEAGQLRGINEFRQKTLGLSARKAGVYTFFRDGKEIPTVYPISSLLFLDVSSWNGHVFLPGFFFLESQETLDPKLAAFLENGSKPLVVSFSSMPLKAPNTFLEKLVDALEKTNSRAVVLSGNACIEAEKSERICAVKQAPHDLLFPKAKGVIHHGGVGTTAAALRAGVPQLIIPFSVDQPFWANRLHKLGYALKPLQEKKLSSEELSHAFMQFSDPALLQKSNHIAHQIQTENGTKRAADYLEGLV